MAYPSRTEVAAATERVRRLCLALPETSERPSHGAPSFFVRDRKCFVMVMDDHHGDAIFGLWVAAPPGNQELLVAAGPERFFRPPYVGHRGWLGVRLDRGVDWDEVAGILEDAWATVAPRRLAAEHAATRGPRSLEGLFEGRRDHIPGNVTTCGRSRFGS